MGREEIVLLALWGKLDRPGAVVADITWMGYTGARVPSRFADAFAAIARGRDAASALVRRSAREGRELRGWEVDRAASDVLREAGYGEPALHRPAPPPCRPLPANLRHLYHTHTTQQLPR